ncbi:hypothetical protein RclHR1_13870007 [Rhizophagus clarus]|uniref:HMG box domain-containing protein n=1 Tax=Rhizophagus clarus TaxID=94130 RepID=A0A2Z6QQY5_9GLOM|nr:hypothetical protein RclHR1_13870007 [Rhizophagus clarus]GES92311.1 hypothetical protein GLOIN_2v709189 [Rhizophagus clarus]
MEKQNSILYRSRTIKISKKNNKHSNGYITFYKFYKRILDKEFPELSSQQKAVKAGEKWRYLPLDLRNSFTEFANNERLLKSLPKNGPPRPQIVRQFVQNLQPKSGLRVIFDDRCHKNVHMSENSNETSSSEGSDYERIFDEYIDKNAYI